MDESDQHFLNAECSSDESLEPGSKMTVESVLQKAKHAASNRSMLFGIITSFKSPKYKAIEVFAKFRRKESTTVKWQLPSPTEICRTGASTKGAGPSASSADGIEKNRRLKQHRNACFSICETVEPDSNVTDERE
jgi:hypothetical protein